MTDMSPSGKKLVRLATAYEIVGNDLDRRGLSKIADHLDRVLKHSLVGSQPLRGVLMMDYLRIGIR